jgi:hypothetical protein
MRFAAPCLVAILIGSPRAPGPQESYKLEWKLGPLEAAEYSAFDISGAKRKPVVPDLILFAREIMEGISPNDTMDIAVALAFRLPQRELKVRESWEVNLEFLQSLAPMAPARVVGRYTLTKIVKAYGADCALIEGAFQVFLGPSKKADAEIETVQWIGTGDGKLHCVRYRFSGKAESWGEQGLESGNRRESMELEWKATHRLEGGAPKKEVDLAVEKGKALLASKQTKNGSFGGVGPTALALAAMLHSGMKRDDQPIRLAFDWLRQQKPVGTYEISCVLIALESSYLPLENFTDIVNFDEKALLERLRGSVRKEDVQWAKTLADALISNQAKSGAWSYSGNATTGDQSNTQFAAMGLKAARRLGVDVPRQTWKRLAEYLMAIQCHQGDPISVKITGFSDSEHRDFTATPGGWTYPHIDNPSRPGFPCRGTVTCGSLAALRICESEIHDETDGFYRRLRGAQESAIAWIYSRYTVRKAPNSRTLHYLYYLYALERAGILNRIRAYDKKDWYTDGAFVLLRLQRGDGCWDAGLGPIIDTSFALLFLKRAVVPVATKSGK